MIMKKLTKAQYHLFVALSLLGMVGATGIFVIGFLIYAVFTGQVF